MKERGFIIISVLMGILIGLAVVTGVFFYPKMLSLYQNTLLNNAKHVNADAVKIVKKIVVVSNVPDFSSTLVSEEKGNDALASDTKTVEKEQHPIPLFPTIIAEKKTKPVNASEISHMSVLKDEMRQNRFGSHYAKEENLWKYLVERKMKPGQMDGYPYAKCFQEAALATDLPFHVLVGMAGYFSNFDPHSDTGSRYGIMHLDWPYPAKRVGAARRDDLKDPCQNIDMAGRLLSGLLHKTDGEWVPALVAFRDQVEQAHPARIQKSDLTFSASLRRYTENVMDSSFEKKQMYLLWQFDAKGTAEEFMASIEKKTDVDLWLRKRGLKYWVYIPARDETERGDIATLIYEKTGVFARN